MNRVTRLNGTIPAWVFGFGGVAVAALLAWLASLSHETRGGSSRAPVTGWATPHPEPQNDAADASDPFAHISVYATPLARIRGPIRKKETPR